MMFSIAILVSSCGNVMDEKVSTKEYDKFIEVVYKVDTLDKIEKDYILKKSKSMIFEVGKRERKYHDIGIQVDTSELETFGNIYKWYSSSWRSKNKEQKENMERNIILDTALINIDILDADVTVSHIGECISYSKVEKYSGYRYSWEFRYRLKFTGKAIIKSNINSLQSFVPDYYFSIIIFPKFTKINDSIFEFEYISKEYEILSYSSYFSSEKTDMSRSDLKFYYDNNYLPSPLLEKICDNSARGNQEKLINESCQNVRIKKLSRTDNYPESRKRIDAEFLTASEYKVFEKLKSDASDSPSTKLLKVKYGLN